MLNLLGIICMTLLLFAFAFGIAQNARNIEFIAKQSNAIAESVSKNRKDMADMKSGHNTAVDIYDAEIAEIVNKLDEFAKDFGRLDALETRVKQAEAKASEAQRLMVLNGLNQKPNGGVPWASEYRCQSDIDDGYAEVTK